MPTVNTVASNNMRKTRKYCT